MNQTIYLKDYKPSPYLIKAIDLDIRLHPTETLVTSKLHIKANSLSIEKSVPLILAGEKLTLITVKVNNQNTKAYKQDDYSLIISGIKHNDSVEITTQINPEGNKALEGLYLTNNVFCTQCEPEGTSASARFRSWSAAAVTATHRRRQRPATTRQPQTSAASPSADRQRSPRERERRSLRPHACSTGRPRMSRPRPHGKRRTRLCFRCQAPVRRRVSRQARRL